MLSSYVFQSEIAILRRYQRQNQNHTGRPLFIFPCGGDERSYHSRVRFRSYIERSGLTAFNNVFCLTAEKIANKNALPKLNLLQQEAMLADICDWIVIFAESVGSFCELGIFSVLEHAAAITTIVVDSKYEHSGGFLNDGPAKEIARLDFPLSKVFYLSTGSPFSNAEFAKFASCFRDNVRRGMEYRTTRDRKKINRDESSVCVGPLAHELLDLLHLVGPIPRDDLFELYCNVKGFDRRSVKVVSTILSEDMKKPVSIDMADVVDMMLAVGLISLKQKAFLGLDVVESNIVPDSYFMFLNDSAAARKSLSEVRASILLRKRAFMKGRTKNVYRRSDS